MKFLNDSGGWNTEHTHKQINSFIHDIFVCTGIQMPCHIICWFVFLIHIHNAKLNKIQPLYDIRRKQCEQCRSCIIRCHGSPLLFLLCFVWMLCQNTDIKNKEEKLYTHNTPINGKTFFGLALWFSFAWTWFRFYLQLFYGVTTFAIFNTNCRKPTTMSQTGYP